MTDSGILYCLPIFIAAILPLLIKFLIEPLESLNIPDTSSTVNNSS